MAGLGRRADDGLVTMRCRARLALPDLGAGQRVRISAGVLKGRKATLIRPARVVLDEGWLVAFDGRPLGLRRLRVASWALLPDPVREPAAEPR